MSAKKQTKKQTKNQTKKKKQPAKRASAAKKDAEPKRRGLSTRVKSILYIALAIFFFILVFVPGSNFWTTIRSFFFGIFGLGMLLVPPFFVYLCVINEKEKQIAHFGAKVVLSILILLVAGALLFAINWGKYSHLNYFAVLGNLYLDCFNSSGYMPLSCGLIGGILGYPIAALCGQPVAIILTVLLLAVLIFIITNLSVKDVALAAKRTAERVRRNNEERARRRRERLEEQRRTDYGDSYSPPKRRKHRKAEPDKVKETPADNDIDIPMNIPIYANGQKLSSSDLNSDIDIPLDVPKRRKRKKDTAPQVNGLDIDYTEQNEQNAADLDNSEDLINIIKRASKPMGEDGETTVEDIAEEITAEKRSNHLSKGAKQADPETVPVDIKRTETKSKEDQPYSEFNNLGYNPNNSKNEIKPEKVYH